MGIKHLTLALVASLLAFAAAPSGIDFNKDGIDDMLVRNTSTGQTFSWLLREDGTRATYKYITTIPSATWVIEGMGDFNGDNITDILVRNITNGQTYSWLMKSDGTRQNFKLITTISNNWEIVGTNCDFNKDGINDIVVRNKTNGWTFTWIMQADGSRKNFKFVTSIPDSDWEIAGTGGDFNGDGISDIVVRNKLHGWTYVWLMNSDGSRNNYKFITNIPENQWEIAGTDNDFNGDGISDIVVRNTLNGSVWTWIMKPDGTRKYYRYITSIPSKTWEIVSTNNEFNKDNVSDLVVWKKDTGDLYVWLMNSDGTRKYYQPVKSIPASSWEIVQTTCDFNRDGTNDFIVRNTTTGTTYSWLMNSNGSRKNYKAISTIPVDEWEIVSKDGTSASEPINPNLKKAMWAAYEENGVWRVLDISNGTTIYTTKKEKFGVATLCKDEDSVRLSIIQATKTEFSTVPIGCETDTSEEPSYTVQGTVSGAQSNSRITLQMDGGFTFMQGNGSYTLTNVAKGKHDLLAVETDLYQNILKVAIQHDINVNHNLTGINIVLNHSVIEHTLQSDGDTAFVNFITKNTSIHMVGNTIFGNKWYAVNPAEIVEGDSYNFTGWANSEGRTKFSLERVSAKKDPGDKTIHVSGIADFHASTDGRLYTTFNHLKYTPALFSPPIREITLDENQNINDNYEITVIAYLTKSWLGNDDTYKMPNFTKMAGWKSSWSFRKGLEIEWKATVVMSTINLREDQSVNFIMHSSSKNGNFTP